MTPTLAPALDLCALPGALGSGCAVAGALAGAATPGAAGALAGGALASVGTAVIGQLADAMVLAWWMLQAKVLTFWTEAPTPTAADLVAPGSTRSWVAWLAQFTLITSVMIAAGRTILTRDGRNLADAGRTVVATILTSALAITVAAALVRSGDAIANALLADALVDGFGSDPQPISAALIAAGGPGGPLLLGILGFLASVIQFFVLLARNAVLPVVVLLLPLAAAAGGAQVGKAWFGRLAAWLLALAFYKPVAAVIYAVVLVQARTADTAMTALIALVGMVTAVLTLPALIKLFSPAPAGGGGGGGGYAVGMAAGAAVRAASSRGGSP